MSEKGGQDKSELRDFEQDASVDDEIRARVERAENETIDQAVIERDSGIFESRRQLASAPSKARLAIITIFGTLLGACFIFLVVLLAIKVGSNEFFHEEPKKKEEASNEIFLLSYQEKSLLYDLGENEPSDTSYLLQDYGLTDNSNYLVITRDSQLVNLQKSFEKFSDEAVNFKEELALDDNFFDSGSVIAVVQEDSLIGSLQTIKVTRDESFGLDIRMKRTDITDVIFDNGPSMVGYLNLIRVDNVQPRELTLYIENN